MPGHRVRGKGDVWGNKATRKVVGTLLPGPSFAGNPHEHSSPSAVFHEQLELRGVGWVQRAEN